MEVVWFWVNNISVSQAFTWIGRRKAIVIGWYNLCRDVCMAQFNKHQKKVDLGSIHGPLSKLMNPCFKEKGNTTITKKW